MACRMRAQQVTMMVEASFKMASACRRLRENIEKGGFGGSGEATFRSLRGWTTERSAPARIRLSKTGHTCIHISYHVLMESDSCDVICLIPAVDYEDLKRGRTAS